ncbi:hypothetical protein N2152v2_002874 [Parachlorella kessleri]
MAGFLQPGHSRADTHHALWHNGSAGQANTATLAKWVELTDVGTAAAEGNREGAQQHSDTDSARLAEAVSQQSNSDPDAAAKAGQSIQTEPEPLSWEPDQDGADTLGGSFSETAGDVHGAFAGTAAGGGVLSDYGTSMARVAPGFHEPLRIVDPSLRCPELSKELLQRHAKASTVMLGVVNSVQQNFGINWVRHVKDAGIEYFVAAAADANTSALLANMQVPCFSIAGPSDGELPMSWGEAGWRQMTWQKVLVLDQVVEWGFNIVISDMDVAWLRDPLPLFEDHPQADVLLSTDGCATVNDVGDAGLERDGNMHHNFNTGVYLLRTTLRSIRWVHAWKALLDTGFQGHDQEGAYQLTRRGEVKPHSGTPRVTTAWDGDLYLGILPTQLMSNGHTYMVQRLHEQKAVQPYAVHATWTYGGSGGKRARFRDAMLWYDDPSYYSGPSFVTVDLRLPQAPEGFNDLQENEHMISFHLSTLQAQLQQAYIGMALAVAAGRAFISPKFQCFCEKIWYAVVKCRVVDAQGLQFPINCPTDYVFEPHHFSDDPSQFGTPLDFREPSFLDNPRTPPEVKESVLVIKPSFKLGCADCVREEKLADGSLNQVLVPTGLNDHQLLALLEPYRRFRVWRISMRGVRGPNEAYAGFACAGAAREFDKRMDHITTEWCCRHEEEAKKYGLQDRIREKLHMTSRPFSERVGLDASC